MHKQLPRWVERMLLWVMPEHRRQDIVGDLEEEYQAGPKSFTRQLWLFRQLLSLSIRYLPSRPVAPLAIHRRLEHDPPPITGPAALPLGLTVAFSLALFWSEASPVLRYSCNPFPSHTWRMLLHLRHPGELKDPLKAFAATITGNPLRHQRR